METFETAVCRLSDIGRHHPDGGPGWDIVIGCLARECTRQ